MPGAEPKGLVEVYTGNGKGKTSAAMGAALRAMGHGQRVHIVYFMKGGYPYGEQTAMAQLPNVTFSRFGGPNFVDPKNVTEDERREAKKALLAAREAVLSGDYDLVILDEVNVAVAWKLLELDEVINLIDERPEKVELILTGRYADPKLVKLADLVTEMLDIKHPYTSGVVARRGIDY